jgi:septal ring factor EnvC (AmiA/AmiB activator)
MNHLFFCSILFLSSLVSAKAFSTSAGSTPVAAQEIISEIQQKKKLLHDQELKQRRALMALYEVERKVKETVSEKARIQNEIEQTSWALMTSERRIDELQKEIIERKKDLVSRLRVFSKVTATDYLNVLATSKNQSDLKRNLKFVEVLIKNDSQKINTAALSSEQLKNEMALLQKQKSDLQVKENQLLVSEARFEQSFELKKQLVKGLKKSRVFNKEALVRLQLQGREMNLEDLGILDQLFKVSIFDAKGRLPWPVQGKVTEAFGWSHSNEKTYMIKNNGLFISTASSAQVRPVFEGEVIAVQAIDDLGTVLVIDHGEHLYSVYGLSGSPLVRQGELVKTSTTLAKTSFVPQYNDSGLYFEIRHYNEPQNPTAWMKGSSL